MFFAKKECGLSITDYLYNIALRCFVSFVIVLFFSIIPINFVTEGFVRVLIVASISTVLFIIVVWFLGLENDERLMFSKMLKEVVNKKRKNSQI